MVRCRLPVPSLLGLFQALLLLSPELLVGIAASLSHVPVTDPRLREALAFAVEQYNQDREESANYFRQLRVLKAQSQKDITHEYHLKVEFTETTCKKKAGRRIKYKRIQKCRLLPGNPEKTTCYFKVIPGSGPYKMIVAVTTCT